MGGQIAHFIGAYFPEKVLSLTLISSSSSFKQLFEPKDVHNENELSRPTEEYTNFIHDPKYLRKSERENLEDLLHTMRLLEGDYKFDREFHEELLKQSSLRSELDPYLSQVKAMRKSYALHSKALQMIKADTLIIQGSIDPLFPEPDHAQSLVNSIANSKMVIIENMGHIINPIFNDQIIELLAGHFYACSDL